MSIPAIVHYQLTATTRARLVRDFGASYTMLQAENLQQIVDFAGTGRVALFLLGLEGGMPAVRAATTLVMHWQLPPAALFILAAQAQVRQEIALFRLGVADYVAAGQAWPAISARIAARLKTRSCALRCRAQDMALQPHQLNYLHHYDLLTGLPNAAQFIDQLARLMQAAAGRQVAVLVACLAHFRDINQVWGRASGDQVLQLVAQRLRRGFGASVALARVSGHSYAIAMECSQPQQLIRLRATLSTLLEQPIELERMRLQPASLIGCAMGSASVTPAETLLRNAEAALQHVQCSGEQFALHTPALHAGVVARLAMENLLRSALTLQQLLFYFQPQIDLLSGHIVGAEALLRWQHPERGLIGPAEFIPLAEQTRLILPIGQWVIDAVCAQQAQWKALGLPIVPVALNLSALQFRSGALLADIEQALARHGLAPSSIELELTETMVMQDPVAAATTMQALRAAGLSLALDDFGTGYSSLAYLKRFPFSSVKMDRAFVTDIATGRVDAAIARAIIGMGHSLRLTVIAEGVETREQLQLLRDSGCDQVQGYYYSQPVPATVFARMLEHGLKAPT
ncbi:putative bifunctional diguanylate cyclase/phosphodiesterase [Duganella qianjiadongensis]|uniref:EAL domain-containing protein n=1 Tax=Duganella qianjiadongensis TaxID=2692176 RepID=A0ABW9VR82_9BURK|nr:bifunctional diguanylate cyclase/phosphodiesterase [Duganella qianjiadongensis]MYM42109.1 EAL domain-containing protein [Duganella qianjiadongensis]